MNAPAPRRRYWRWILAGLVLLLAPVVIVAGGVISMLTLDRDAAALKREVAHATGSDWHTKVQFSAGWITLGALRTGLLFVHHENIDDARLALAAVRNASVGVYERRNDDGKVPPSELLAQADEVMTKRGWTRLIAVVDGREQVIIYQSNAGTASDKVDICLAILDRKELVVVSTRVEAAAVAQLVKKHAGGKFRSKLKVASFEL